MSSRSERTRASPQLIVFSYHKTGTSLFLHVMTKVCAKLGLSLVNYYGLVERLDPEPDVVLLPHSLLRDPIDWPYRAIRLICDPRDIWVSGYLYHLRCDEEWCRNTDMDPAPPIRWPRVDYSFAHRSEEWKRAYLEGLNGKSYQQNLRDRSLAAGLAFELEGYTSCTLETMREWKQNGIDALDVRLEDVMEDFDGAMLRIFDHFKFSKARRMAALHVARTEDIRRMDQSAIAKRPQIHSRKISKWRGVLSMAQITSFELDHGDLIRELGCEPAGLTPTYFEAADTGVWFADVCTVRSTESDRINAIPSPIRQPAESAAQDAKVWLTADGKVILPVATSKGSYGFVVPAGRSSVRLESGVGIAPGMWAPDPDGVHQVTARDVGVRVSRIAIQSDAGDLLVIAPDDPGLRSGWHAAERSDNQLWRWTDGSAALPWSSITGPAVITIYCLPRDDGPARGSERPDARRKVRGSKRSRGLRPAAHHGGDQGPRDLGK